MHRSALLRVCTRAERVFSAISPTIALTVLAHPPLGAARRPLAAWYIYGSQPSPSKKDQPLAALFVCYFRTWKLVETASPIVTVAPQPGWV